MCDNLFRRSILWLQQQDESRIPTPGSLGSLDANSGDVNNGWDTFVDATLCLSASDSGPLWGQSKLLNLAARPMTTAGNLDNSNEIGSSIIR